MFFSYLLHTSRPLKPFSRTVCKLAAQKCGVAISFRCLRIFWAWSCKLEYTEFGLPEPNRRNVHHRMPFDIIFHMGFGGADSYFVTCKIWMDFAPITPSFSASRVFKISGTHVRTLLSTSTFPLPQIFYFLCIACGIGWCSERQRTEHVLRPLWLRPTSSFILWAFELGGTTVWGKIASVVCWKSAGEPPKVFSSVGWRRNSTANEICWPMLHEQHKVQIMWT